MPPAPALMVTTASLRSTSPESSACASSSVSSLLSLVRNNSASARASASPPSANSMATSRSSRVERSLLERSMAVSNAFFSLRMGADFCGSFQKLGSALTRSSNCLSLLAFPSTSKKPPYAVEHFLCGAGFVDECVVVHGLPSQKKSLYHSFRLTWWQL